jgi:two-component system OmpR family sensor kinase
MKPPAGRTSAASVSPDRTQISIRGYRAGFLFVVALLAGVATFTLWSALSTNAEVDALVERALERDQLIALIRVDALLLEEAVETHIKAVTDEERSEADQQMAFILDEIKRSSDRYIEGLPPREVALWNRFTETSQALARQVRTTVRYSNRKEAERARKHLVEEVKPLTWDLGESANALAMRNAEETRILLRQLEDIRLRATLITAGVAVLAVLLAMAVGWKVTRLLARQERTILDQVTELDRRNEELDAFASRVAHDLVSPLSPLKGYLTLLKRSNSINDASAREMLVLAETSASRMTELIEALLRFCRAGKPSEPTASELDTAVSTLLLEVSQSATAARVKLERLLEPGLFVSCPPQLLQSIAQNILSNAVKYTAGRPEAKVTVRVIRERAHAVLEVSDNGRGMSPTSQAQLFQPFFRAPEAKHLPGYGLGMATTKRLVEAHGGAIEVRSELEVGTQVTVRLPLADGSETPQAGVQVTA